MAITYNTRTVRDGLVLHLDAANRKSYPGSGTTWTDLSGRGNNGTLLNGITGTAVNGPVFNGSHNGSFLFDGVDDFVSVGQPTGYNSNLGTLVMWIYPTLSTSNTFFQQYNGDSNRLRLAHDAGKISAFSGFLSTTLDLLSANNTSPINTWIQVGFTYNFSSNVFNLYINNNLSSTVTDTDVPDISGIGEVVIGCAKDFDNPSPFYSGYFNGRISDVKFYNRELTAQEIFQNFEAHRGRYGV